MNQSPAYLGCLNLFRNPKTAVYGLIGLAMAACAPVDRGHDKKGQGLATNWEESLKSEVEVLGAKNWIIVSEKAYPISKSAGVKVINADVDLPEALAGVLEAIESEGHIWPKIYSLKEFEFVDEDYAPGIKRLAAKREAVMAERKSQKVTKKTAEMMLKVAMNDFRVLVVKTESAYPYSSIFMELDSGYWNGESEEELRTLMNAQ